jgi:cytochrome oxidase assembly protein ShyY1
VSGRYIGDTVRVTSRDDGGEWVVGLAETSQGMRVPVGRGWVRAGTDVAAPPSGEVTIEGYLVPRPRLDRIARVDLEDVFAGDSALDGLVQATSSQPADDERLTPVEPPELGDGPHLSYAVQWFVFATIAAVGYPLALRRIARHRESSDS